MPCAASSPGRGPSRPRAAAARKPPRMTTQPTARNARPAAAGWRLIVAITPGPEPWHRVRMTTSSQRPQGNVAPVAPSSRPIDPGVTIGHVHLRTVRHRPRARLLRRRARLRRRRRGARRARLGHDGRHPLRLRRRLSPSPRLQHVEVGRRRRRSPTASPGCTTSPSAIRRAPAWPMRCGACARSTGRCARSPTTARTRRSTSATPTATTSSCAGTARSSSGRATPTATCRAASATSTSTTCWRSRRRRASATGPRARRRAGV